MTRRRQAAASEQQAGSDQPAALIQATIAKKPATSQRKLRSSAVHMKEAKYVLVGPPSYYVANKVHLLYNLLYDLVESNGQSGQADPVQLVSKLTEIVNDLSDVIEDSTPWLARGLASFQEKLTNHKHPHQVDAFMTEGELAAAGLWRSNNPGIKPPVRNYTMDCDLGKRPLKNKNSTDES